MRAARLARSKTSILRGSQRWRQACVVTDLLVLIPTECTRRKDEVRNLFLDFGPVKDVYLPLNYYTRCASLHQAEHIS